jgi:hypothetical protein
MRQTTTFCTFLLPEFSFHEFNTDELDVFSLWRRRGAVVRADRHEVRCVAVVVAGTELRTDLGDSAGLRACRVAIGGICRLCISIPELINKSTTGTDFMKIKRKTHMVLMEDDH